MRRRIVTAITAVAGMVLVSLAAVGVGSASASGAVDIPDGPWSGTVTVSFSGYGAGYHSVRVLVNQSSDGTTSTQVTRPYTGAPVDVPVQTWGFSGVTNVRAQVCTDEAGAVCDDARVVQRTVTQDATDAVTADVEISDNPVLVPEDQTHITLHNPGGGELWLSPAFRERAPIAAETRTDLTDLWPHYVTRGRLIVLRCPAGREAPFMNGQPVEGACEQFDLGREVTVVRDLDLYVDQVRDHAVSDSTAEGFHTLGAYLSVDARTGATTTWSLLDGDTVVRGPGRALPAGTFSGEFAVPVEGVPDGDYTLRVTASLSRGDVTKSEHRDFPVKVAANPPDEGAELGSFSASVDEDDVRRDRPASVEVGWDRNLYHPGYLRVLDGSGHRIWQGEPSYSDCRGDTCMLDPNAPSWWDLSWDGTTDAGAAAAPGNYTAEFFVQDDWGRMVRRTDPIDLWVDHLVTRTKQVRMVPAEHTYAFNTYGTCSSAPSPGPHGWAGSVGILSLSKCADATGKKDWLFRTFLLPANAPDQDRVITWRADVYAGPMKPGMVGGVVYDDNDGYLGPEWRRHGTLSGSLGWKIGDVHRPDPAHGTGSAMVQARVTNGNKWDLKFWRLTWSYRAWTR